MIVPDANLLIYAVNADAEQHEAARCWLEDTLSGDRPVGFAWPVLLAFLRITTRAGLFESPLTADEAVEYVNDWLALPMARQVSPGERHWSALRSLLRAAGTAGNLCTDAHLAALAIEHGATLASADNDFRRFAGLDYVNPLT